jgi:ATP-binding cassette subfamily C (CFTR/MRP) protein 1
VSTPSLYKSLTDIVGLESSLLQGLIGEMKRSKGDITFSGSVAYCPQAAWIQVSQFLLDHIFGRQNLRCHVERKCPR